MKGAQWSDKIEGFDMETGLGQSMKGHKSAWHAGPQVSTLTLA